MTRYLILLKFTTDGAKNIKKSPARARDFRKLAESAGVKVEGQYWTTGRYDGALVQLGDDAAGDRGAAVGGRERRGDGDAAVRLDRRRRRLGVALGRRWCRLRRSDDRGHRSKEAQRQHEA